LIGGASKGDGPGAAAASFEARLRRAPQDDVGRMRKCDSSETK